MASKAERDEQLGAIKAALTEYIEQERARLKRERAFLLVAQASILGDPARARNEQDEAEYFKRLDEITGVGDLSGVDL